MWWGPWGAPVKLFVRDALFGSFLHCSLPCLLACSLLTYSGPRESALGALIMTLTFGNDQGTVQQGRQKEVALDVHMEYCPDSPQVEAESEYTQAEMENMQACEPTPT